MGFIDFDSEIKKISDSVLDFIENDSFAEQIVPIELAEAVVDYPEHGGKRIRPTLLLWTCGMLNGDVETALPAAVAVEIYHNWTLVHDDIIDQDKIRRGRPTSHIFLQKYAETAFRQATYSECEAFGKSFAILCGDIQQGWAIDILCKLTDYGFAPDLVLRLVHAMQTDLNRKLISGEALDVEFAYWNPNDVKEEDVLLMIDGKTSEIFRFAVQAGAALAIGRYEPLSTLFEKLSEFAMSLGRAFQIQDDLLDVFGDVKQSGKTICSDFQEAKPTLLYLSALRRMNQAGAKELSSYLGLPNYHDEKTVSRIRQLLTECGAKQELSDMADSLTKKAISILETFPDNKYRSLLIELSKRLTGRMN